MQINICLGTIIRKVRNSRRLDAGVSFFLSWGCCCLQLWLMQQFISPSNRWHHYLFIATCTKLLLYTEEGLAVLVNSCLYNPVKYSFWCYKDIFKILSVSLNLILCISNANCCTYKNFYCKYKCIILKYYYIWEC